MKGIEGLPLKYIAMLIVAALVVAALVYVANLLAVSSIDATQTANSTLITALNQSLGNAVSQNVSP